MSQYLRRDMESTKCEVKEPAIGARWRAKQETPHAVKSLWETRAWIPLGMSARRTQDGRGLIIVA